MLSSETQNEPVSDFSIIIDVLYLPPKDNKKRPGKMPSHPLEENICITQSMS
jgi:hypothetical protein